MSVPAYLTTRSENLDLPEIRTLQFADLGAALAEGWRDFWMRPSHLAFLGLLYPLIGTGLAVWTSGSNSWPLLYPLISGFALVGPFAALPIYEMSRRIEMGLDTGWMGALSVFRSPSIRSIAAVGVFLLALFTVWLMVGQSLYEDLFGPGVPASLQAFVTEVTATPEGVSMAVWGNLIGFAFAAVVLVSTLVSVPLLLDRDVGAAVAVHTSLRVALRSPLVVATWGLIVAALLVLGSLPVLIGLCVVVPVLGHATWHLYRRAVPVPAVALPRQGRSS
jgi:uncharacterized membrane protein